MDAFRVGNFSEAGEMLLIGIVAGALYFLLNKYVFVPAEGAAGLVTAA